ncbi:MAG: glycerophosphodiester phosphodiesterase family protein [Bacteroidales bacterium]|nr:glycerophosphodiester phosphodiesterase family protein [Bacteroidales bacterium]
MKTILLVVLSVSILNNVNAQATVKGVDTLNSGKPTSLLIAGHRGGYDTSLPENSFALFDSTISRVCNLPVALEFDIRESASGNLFLMHDPEVDRTTGGHGLVSALTDSLIGTLSLKDRNDSLTRHKVPSFTELLRRYRDRNVILMLDVKGDIYSRVFEQVKLFGMEDRCIILTFNLKDLKMARDLTTEMRISALVTSEEMWELVKSACIPPSRLIAYITNQTPENVVHLIRKEKTLVMTDMNETTTNRNKPFEPEYYTEILKIMQPDILITDYPVFVSQHFFGK